MLVQLIRRALQAFKPTAHTRKPYVESEIRNILIMCSSSCCGYDNWIWDYCIKTPAEFEWLVDSLMEYFEGGKNND